MASNAPNPMQRQPAPEPASETGRERGCPCQERQRDSAAAAFSDWVTGLVHQHRARLARVARREGLAAEDAFDVVQEAFTGFLVLPRARALLESPDDARKLLVTLTRNLARNRRRLHARARPHDAGGAADQLAAPAPPPDERLALVEDQQRLVGCVQRLADVQRAVVTMRMLDEVPGQDVARLLGIPAGHVAVLLHRAKASLLACMTHG